MPTLESLEAIRFFQLTCHSDESLFSQFWAHPVSAHLLSWIRMDFSPPLTYLNHSSADPYVSQRSFLFLRWRVNMEIYLLYEIIYFSFLLLSCFLPSFFTCINLPYLRPWPEDLFHSSHAPSGTVLHLSSDQRGDWRIGLFKWLAFSPSLPFLCIPSFSYAPHFPRWGWLVPVQKLWGLVGFGYLGPFLHVHLALGPSLKAYALPLLFSQGQVVGSNSVAAKFHSSCANLPAFIPRALFLLTKLLYLFGERKKYFVFKSIF